MKHRTCPLRAALAAVLVLVMLCVPALAAEIAVDYTSEYKFAAADFSGLADPADSAVSAAVAFRAVRSAVTAAAVSRAEDFPVAAAHSAAAVPAEAFNLLNFSERLLLNGSKRLQRIYERT